MRGRGASLTLFEAVIGKPAPAYRSGDAKGLRGNRNDQGLGHLGPATLPPATAASLATLLISSTPPLRVSAFARTG
jgi:hypothetical protein